jgi:thiol:disulfide interchange protein DsbC
MFKRLLLALVAASFAACAPAADPEAKIRKNLAERMPQLPKIDEVSKTPIPGIYEIRIGSDVLYSDAEGDHIIEGALYDTRARQNLTEARIAKLTAIDFASLPLKDAMVVKQGNGKRKLVVFADPNCGYCKAFERDLQKVKDITIYTFLYPVLGPDSDAKSRAIWCSKDAQATWRSWMIEGKLPSQPAADCDTAALARNLALGRKHRVNGTPGLVFEDGRRVAGMLPPPELEKQLVESSPKS